MTDTLTAPQIHTALIDLCDTIDQQKDYLSELDGAIGDGDHGANMSKCFRGVKAKLEATDNKDVGAVLSTVGMEVMNSVGGAMGALFGTFFIKLSLPATGKAEVTLQELSEMFDQALEGVLTIGKAKVGDKTLIDTLSPAVAALKAGAESGKSLSESLADLEEAAKIGMESTKDLMAKMGRASRLGERSIGHIDAGATSCCFVLQSFNKACKV